MLKVKQQTMKKSHWLQPLHTYQACGQAGLWNECMDSFARSLPCGASSPYWGRGWGSNSPSTHSVAISRETKVRVLVIASVSELKIWRGFVYFSTSGLNPFSPFFPHCQHHSVRYLHLPGLLPSSLSHLLTSGFVSLICALVMVWLPSLDTLDVIF